jgi:hypothetical protein
MQKKAANTNSLYVLITSSEAKGGYGEVPGWDFEGIAYGDSPPTDTATVNANIRKMLQKKKEREENLKKKKK